MNTPYEQKFLSGAMSRSSQLLNTSKTSSSESEPTSSSSNLSRLRSDMRPIEKFNTDLNNLPDVPQIDAFKRGYEVESLLDMVENNFGEQYLYIKFKHLLDPELVPLGLAVKNVGHLLPRFYKDYLKAWNKWEAVENENK